MLATENAPPTVSAGSSPRMGRSAGPMVPNHDCLRLRVDFESKITRCPHLRRSLHSYMVRGPNVLSTYIIGSASCRE
jgi:hypothetical protein